MTRGFRHTMRMLQALGTLLCIAGCATSAPGQRSPADPWEPLNRNIHAFNDTLDSVTLKPVAKAYEKAVPSTARLGVTNFSRNLRSPLNLINSFLQGKPRDGFTEAGRFLANTTFGLLGVLDVATDMGLESHDEDFGQTLAAWGVPDGPYVVVPMLGPRTLRDALAIPLNFLADPLLHYDNSSVRDRLYVLRLVDVRHRLFAAEGLIKDSTDRYLTIRESYLQRRQYLIHDGDPPVDEDFYDDFYDDEYYDDGEEPPQSGQ
ncbi:MAG: VacJ family lipoprotein [Gammaproteobacteria bacterium]|nr:VacJ family lipoprotein [Gammaproteobacteria bacterium]